MPLAGARLRERRQDGRPQRWSTASSAGSPRGACDESVAESPRPGRSLGPGLEEEEAMPEWTDDHEPTLADPRWPMEGPIDPAHLIPRSLGGCGDTLCVVL